MATYTEHYNLKKPQVNEQYNIADFNGNADILDDAMYQIAQGGPAVHYSTDEQVVGTWVDGKTLYQKTIVTNAQVALSDNSWTVVPFASGDVPSDADTMFCTEWFNPSDSHLICDNRTRFVYDYGAIKGATSQTGGQTVPAGLTLTIRYTKTS